MNAKKRNLILFIVSLIAFMCLGIRYILLWTTSSDISNRLLQTQQSLSSEQLLAAKLKHQMSSSSQSSNQSKLPHGPHESDLIREIERASKDVSVVVSSESFSGPNQTASQGMTASGNEGTANNPSTSVNLNLSVEGDSTNLLNFIDKIESFPRPSKIQNAVVNFTGNGAQLTLAVTLPYLP